ncbi:TadE/TadG family type IV pilus assembly protein [Novosphingobium ginsenosidimutans]|uniref:Putative Flp pilus-assembly TadG-like N-terminal domain-containing protein n=1 Tax=Novosphingobium ginsenosidimutans TaxID=1176536 RepID=A0A5B8S3A6_9SPHN|nr:pilus assembly protein TadG-related protein [Novosphingobium ginsenosidimutans]QEA15598.1 hypothetical protein FRF71_05295 [Novosphingobium ginsenosidimutans]
MQTEAGNSVDADRLAEGRLMRFLRRFLHQQLAAVAPMMALMLIPIVGGVAYAVELGSWQYIQRSAQNAADSAALAAAIVNSNTGTTSQIEARAAASKLGFVNGAGAETVTAASVACPVGVRAGSTCFEAVVGTSVPFSLSGVLGFSGNQTIRARAVAVAAGGGSGALTNEVCVWTFNNLQTNGTPDADLSGCAALSNGNMTCTGNGLDADFAVAAGTVSGTCASQTANNISGQTDLPSDPYAGMVNSIPANTCSTYPQAPSGPRDPALPGTNRISGSRTGVVKLCGDVQLTGNLTLTGTATQLVIYNGKLDLNRFTVSTATGASATVIFSGTNGGVYKHYPVDNGTGSGSGVLNIQAPTNAGAAFKGVAIYQDPRITTGVDFTYAGNKPAWKITGAIYLPKSSVTFSGIVDKADNGAYCQILVAYNVTINGTGKIIGDVGGCTTAGIDTPDVIVRPAIADRPKLVQ